MPPTDPPNYADLIAEARRLDAAAPQAPWLTGEDVPEEMRWHREQVVFPWPESPEHMGVLLEANGNLPRDVRAAIHAYAARARTLLPALATALEASERERLRAEDEVTALRAQRDSVQRTNEALARDLAAAIATLDETVGLLDGILDAGTPAELTAAIEAARLAR